MAGFISGSDCLMDEVAAVGEIEPLRSQELESGQSASMDSERGHQRKGMAKKMSLKSR